MIGHKRVSKTLRAFLVACGVCLVSSALFADVSYRLLGPTLKVTVPADSVGDKVVFVWDSVDRGDDIANWAHAAVVAESAPEGGAIYRLDLPSLGVTEGAACGLVSIRPYRYLDTLGTFNGAYVLTSVKDTDCYGVSFGFYATTKTSDWGYFIGTAENNGFVIGNNSASAASWNWAYRNGKKSPRPSVRNDSINEVSFHDAQFWLNGSRVQLSQGYSMDAGSVGLSGNSFCIGRWLSDGRIQSGWWSHVELKDSDGKNLIEYVPVQGADGTAYFYDKVSGAPVKPTSGTFTAGTPTGETLLVALPHRAFVAKDCEPITLSVSDARLAVNVPAYFAGGRLELVWDDVDRGDDPSAWANTEVLASVIPAGGGRVFADLRKLGVKNGQTVSVVALHRFEMLDRVKISEASYVDTGVKDSDCTRAAFGFYAEKSDYSNTEWGIFIGTYDGNSADRTGFVLSLENGNPEKWYWKACGYRSGTRPTVSKTTINEAEISQAGFFVNGTTVYSPLVSQAMGTTGNAIYLGKGSVDYRHQAGWWSHLELAGMDGENVIDYVPVRRTGDGKVGFYDRVGNTFVGPSGTAEMEAGTVTNASFSTVQLRTTVIPRIDEPLKLALDGSRLAVSVPARYALDRLVLKWGGRTEVLAAVVPADGGAYEADLQALGIGRDDVCTVVAEQNLQLLDQLKMSDATTYVDTGIPECLCHGVSFGFYGNESNGDWGCLIGTYEANDNPDSPGFVIGMNNASFNSWYWSYQGIKRYPRPTVKTDSINEVTFANGVFSLNGQVVVPQTPIPSGPVGLSERNMFLGAWQPLNRFLYGWWSYVRFTDAGGNAILDYIPASRVADGAVGFLDRATGAFVTSTGGGAFTAGSVTNAAYAYPHATRTFTVGGLVATATWTGSGAWLLDPASWSCRNFDGEVVTAIPTPETAVVIPDGVTFSVPADSAFLCRTIELPATLGFDCDLRGVALDQFAAKDLDLKGRSLSVSLVAEATQAMTVTDTVGGGVFRLTVAAGLTATNKAVAFAGGLTFAKEGEGVFVAAKKNQTYTGGTEILAGTFMCGGKGSEGVYGATDGTLTVGPGATLDVNGYNGHTAAKLVLAGGEVANTRSASNPNGGWFADIELTADSFARADRYLCFQPDDGGRAKLEMNGHKLTIDVNPDYTFGLYDLTVTGGGTIYGRSGGFIQLVRVTAETTTLEAGSHSLDVASPTTFLNYIARYTGNWDKSPNAPIRVLGRFTPVGSSWHSVEFQDGAVLDLSQKSGVWSATCEMPHYAGPSSISFVDGATVTIDVGERQPALGDQLVSWPTKPAGARFAWNLDLPLHAKSKGLFVQERPGLVILVR